MTRRRGIRPFRYQTGHNFGDFMFSRIDRSTACWVWIGSRDIAGYGRAGFEFAGRKAWLAHRLMWTAFNGPIPEGLDLDHLCRNKACVNPDHLEPVTRSENIRRGAGNHKTQAVRPAFCPAGHRYDRGDLRTEPLGPGQRRSRRWCRDCNRIRKAQRDGRPVYDYAD